MTAFITALSLDAFMAAFAYGADRVKIPVSSVLVLTSLSACVLLFSLTAGNSLGALVPEYFAKGAAVVLLSALGILKLFDSSCKAFLRKLEPGGKKLSFSMAGIKVILNIYGDPEKANEEEKEVLSPKEAFRLGLALSLDSVAAGLGAGALRSSVWELFFLSFFIGLMAVLGGNLAGNRLAARKTDGLSFISGGLLLFLAMKELFF